MGLHVFAGSLKGKPLLTLKGAAIRPTSGKVREAIFNIIRQRVSSASILDLFAGSGALGIEALSYGAQLAVFIEEDPGAISVLQKNISRCGIGGCSRVIRWDICRSLDCLSGFQDSFDLVFVDPPYNQGAVIPALLSLSRSGSLRNGAVIVVEHGAKEPMQNLPGFSIFDQRKYGKSLVSFLEDVL